MTREQKIEICRNLLADNKNRFCKVDFIKKDGTIRRMTLHKSKKLEATVNGMHPLITSKANETLRANGMMRVEEFDDGYVLGNVYMPEDSTLFTSIPFFFCDTRNAV